MSKTMNQMRTERTQMIAAVLYDDDARDDHSAYIDMLSDIMHASRKIGLSFTNMLEAAKSHFDAEIHDDEVAPAELRGPAIHAMEIARKIAKLQGEGLFHSAIDDVLADTDREIDELLQITRQDALEEEQFEFDELSADAQSQVRSNSGGMSDDDIIANGNTYDLSGNTL